MALLDGEEGETPSDPLLLILRCTYMSSIIWRKDHDEDLLEKGPILLGNSEKTVII